MEVYEMMKKNHLLIISVFLCVLLVFVSAGSVFALTIPSEPSKSVTTPTLEDISDDFTDAVFKQKVWEWLGKSGSPGKFTQLEITSKMDDNNYKLLLSSAGIKSLDGIEHFDGLRSLNLYANKLTSLPELPDTLQSLDLKLNEIKTVAKLPKQLEHLDISYNKLTSLPRLPNTLKTLGCSHNEMAELPQLPSNLEYLNCSYNKLASLPALPQSIGELNLSNNYLNVFGDPLRNELNSLNAVMTIGPQFRITYKGSPLTLDINGTKQLTGGDIIRQMSSDGWVWGDVEDIVISSLAFSSTDNSVVKVDSAGLVTGKGQGTASVTATLMGIDSALTKVSIPVIVSSQTAAEEETVENTDVDYMSASSWAVSELEIAEGMNLFTDKVKTNLKQDITREEFCGIAVKLYEKLSGKQALPCTVNPFADTSDIDVLKAYELDIVKGVSADRFAPASKISRQEICVMITRALKAAKPNLTFTVTDYDRFDDENKIASWAINEVRFANKNNIMKGVGGNTINPLGQTSREQGVILIKRTYENFLNQ